MNAALRPAFRARHAVVALALATVGLAAEAAPPDADTARVDVVGQLPLRMACPSVDEAALADDLAIAWSDAPKPSAVAVTFKVQHHHVYDVAPGTDSPRAFHAIRHVVHQMACDGGDDQPHPVSFVIRFVDGRRDAPVAPIRDDAGN
jgi:hypothetical protein